MGPVTKGKFANHLLMPPGGVEVAVGVGVSPGLCVGVGVSVAGGGSGEEVGLGVEVGEPARIDLIRILAFA